MKRYLILGLLCATAVFGEERTPEFPKVFDSPTVLQMIADVDKGTNFPVLKVGYFLGKTRPPFPISSGLNVLGASIKKERRASKRWLLMQWLRAFGTLRQSSSNRDKAMVIYADIFRAANGTPQMTEGVLVRRIVDDLVFNISTELVTGNGQDTEFTEIALQEAIKSHFRLGSSLKHLQSNVRPDFASAVAAVKSDNRILASIVEEAEKDETIPKSYDFYFSAEQILRACSRAGSPSLKAKALTLLDKGENLLKPGDPLCIEVKKERENLIAEGQ